MNRAQSRVIYPAFTLVSYNKDSRELHWLLGSTSCLIGNSHCWLDISRSPFAQNANNRARESDFKQVFSVSPEAFLLHVLCSWQIWHVYDTWQRRTGDWIISGRHSIACWASNLSQAIDPEQIRRSQYTAVRRKALKSCPSFLWSYSGGHAFLQTCMFQDFDQLLWDPQHSL